MTLSSMTGFARVSGQWQTYSWVWEIKSVNGRGLDIRGRMPSGLETMDMVMRNSLKKHLSRGSVNVNLVLKNDTGGVNFTINQPMLDALTEVAVETSSTHHLPQPTIGVLLGIKDVIQYGAAEEDEEALKARNVELEKSFLEAVEALKASRAEEGAAMQTALGTILDEIEGYVSGAAEIAATLPDQLKARFQEKVDALLGDVKALDADRVAQEVVLLATKADIKEELDRLVAHIAAARGYLQATGPIGRKLDFLTQEFNREANTLCSKAADIALTNIGLSLKTAIDQFREQIQNIE